MGVVNIGGQFISYSFQEQLTSPNFNLGLKNIIKPGFYYPQVGSLTIPICTHTAGNAFTLNPFTVWIQGTNAGAVSIATSVAINIPTDVVGLVVSSASPVFYMTWTSSPTNSTYLDFGFCATINALPNNAICICTCLFAGSNLTGFDYTYTTIGSYTPNGECLNGYYQNTNTSNSTIVLRDGTGNIQGNQLQSTVAQGTPPLTAISTTEVSNLNSDMLDGYHASNVTASVPISNGTLNVNLNSDMVDSCNVETSLSGGTTYVPRSDAVKTYVDNKVEANHSTSISYIILDNDGYYNISANAAVTITLPLKSSNRGRRIRIINTSSVNPTNVTIATNASDPTTLSIDGLATIILPYPGDFVEFIEDATSGKWLIVNEKITAMLRLNTYGGYGSVQTAIMRFVNSVVNVGNIFTENHSTGYNSNQEGLNITIKLSGVYTFTLTGFSGNDMTFGFSLNSNQLTISIQSISISNMLCTGNITAGRGSATSWTGKLSKGDVVRAHAMPGYTMTSPALLTVAYIG